MLILLDLHSFTMDMFNKRFKTQSTKQPELTPSWLDEKFERFYLVESTSHREEEFTTYIELRYQLRSGEARKFGKGHQAFYDRYLSTVKVELKYIDDPETYKKIVREEFSEHLSE